jgi:hypothetical protein
MQAFRDDEGLLIFNRQLAWIKSFLSDFWVAIGFVFNKFLRMLYLNNFISMKIKLI